MPLIEKPFSLRLSERDIIASKPLIHKALRAIEREGIGYNLTIIRSLLSHPAMTGDSMRVKTFSLFLKLLMPYNAPGL